MKNESIPPAKLYGYVAIIVIGFGALAWGTVRMFTGGESVPDKVQQQADEITRQIQAHEPPPGTRPDELEPEPPPPGPQPKSLRGG